MHPLPKQKYGETVVLFLIFQTKMVSNCEFLSTFLFLTLSSSFDFPLRYHQDMSHLENGRAESGCLGLVRIYLRSLNVGTLGLIEFLLWQSNINRGHREGGPTAR